jgi:hypothetical protein
MVRGTPHFHIVFRQFLVVLEQRAGSTADHLALKSGEMRRKWVGNGVFGEQCVGGFLRDFTCGISRARRGWRVQRETSPARRNNADR